MADLPIDEGPRHLRAPAKRIEELFWYWREARVGAVKRFDNPKVPNRKLFLAAAQECIDRKLTPETLVMRRMSGAVAFGMRIVPQVLVSAKLREFDHQLLSYGDTTERCRRYLVDVKTFEHRAGLYGTVPSLRDFNLEILPVTRYLLAKQHDVADVMERTRPEALFEAVFYEPAIRAMFPIGLAAELLP